LAATAAMTTLAAAMAVGTAIAVPEGAGPTAPPVAVSDAQSRYLDDLALAEVAEQDYLAALALHFGYGPDADTSEDEAVVTAARTDNQAREITPIVLAATVVNEFGSLTQIDGDLFRGDNATGAGVEAPLWVPQYPSAN
jgi:hypothetical protein